VAKLRWPRRHDQSFLVVLLPGSSPVVKPSLPASVPFFPAFEPLFHQSLEEATGAAEQAALFFPEDGVVKDLLGIGHRFFKEPSPEFLHLGRDDACHVGVPGKDHPATFVVLDNDSFTKGASNEAKQEGNTFHKEGSFAGTNLKGLDFLCKHPWAKRLYMAALCRFLPHCAGLDVSNPRLVLIVSIC
jgi:hypothetical protein